MRQSSQMSGAINRTKDTGNQLNEANKTVSKIKRSMQKNKLALLLTLFILGLAIILIIYFKLFRGAFSFSSSPSQSSPHSSSSPQE